jgi:phosphonate transport system permease protein
MVNPTSPYSPSSMPSYGRVKSKAMRNRLIITLVVLIFVYVSAVSCKVDFGLLISGIPDGINFISNMLPPDLSAVKDLIKPAFDTIIFALLATIFGSILSLLCGLAGASNIAPVWLRSSSRIFMAFERALPEIIVILLLISALGIGAFAGVAALSLGCVGMLGKLFADAIEEVNPKILESIESVGGNKWQMIMFGVIPEIMPSIVTNSIFRFEVNIRLSVLMGAVGAGGIGYELYHSFNILQYERATTAILITLFLVFVSEKLSGYLRKKVTTSYKLK